MEILQDRACSSIVVAAFVRYAPASSKKARNGIFGLSCAYFCMWPNAERKSPINIFPAAPALSFLPMEGIVI